MTTLATFLLAQLPADFWHVNVKDLVGLLIAVFTTAGAVWVALTRPIHKKFDAVVSESQALLDKEKDERERGDKAITAQMQAIVQQRTDALQREKDERVTADEMRDAVTRQNADILQQHLGRLGKVEMENQENRFNITRLTEQMGALTTNVATLAETVGRCELSQERRQGEINGRLVHIETSVDGIREDVKDLKREGLK